MEFCREKISLRKTERFYKFGSLKKIPTKKIFRSSKEHFLLLILFLIIIFLLTQRIKHVEDSVRMSLGIFILSIFAFGFAVKLILSLLFPIIVLNEKGIKLIGSKPIRWAEVRRIKVKYNLNFEQVIYITTINSKLIIKNIIPDHFPQLHLYCRSFLRKYKESV